MILVTGAAGFIGSNLVATLNDNGRDDLILCDRVGDDGRWQNLAGRSFAHFLLPEQLFDWLASSDAQEVDLVLHMGAITDTTVRDGNLVIERNYQFTKRLWAWCASTRATLVYASSAATYGDGSFGFSDALPLKELKRLRPLNLYGWSKHVFDLYALTAPRHEPAHWYGLKFFNVFGPNEYHKGTMRSVLCKLAPEILSGHPVKLFRSDRVEFADGGQSRDFICVEDVCRAVLHFASAPAPSGLYNVGTGQARSFADLVAAGFRAAGHETRIDYVPMPDELSGRYQYFTQADTRKLQFAGFDVFFEPLETSVERFVTRYLAADCQYR